VAGLFVSTLGAHLPKGRVTSSPLHVFENTSSMFSDHWAMD
jgi:hypothetical protein